MATNKPYGDNRRIGAVKNRSQFQTPSGLWAKRDTETGRIMDLKQDGTPFKGFGKKMSGLACTTRTNPNKSYANVALEYHLKCLNKASHRIC